MASILWVPVIFCSASAFLYWLSSNLPELDQFNEDETIALKFPSSLEDLNSMSSRLSRYKAQHFHYVFLLFGAAYLYKQTFAIPGSVFLNVLAGAIFGLRTGFIMTCALTSCGATGCYLMSKFFGKDHVLKHFHEKLDHIQRKIKQNEDGLFFFLLFLRLFPMTPNWFLNVASPILNIPIYLFFCSVLIGLMPYNYICVETGCILSQVTNINDILSFQTCLKMAGIATAALIPGVLLHKHRKKNSFTEK